MLVVGDVIVMVGEVVLVGADDDDDDDDNVKIYPLLILVELFNRISLPEIVTSALPSPDSIK